MPSADLPSANPNVEYRWVNLGLKTRMENYASSPGLTQGHLFLVM